MTITELWRENIRNGVEALGFHVLRRKGEPPLLVAEVGQGRIAPNVVRSAYAAIETHKLVGFDPLFRDLERPHAALLDVIEHHPAIDQLATYQTALADALWRRVSSNPEDLIAELASPHL